MGSINIIVCNFLLLIYHCFPRHDLQPVGDDLKNG